MKKIIGIFIAAVLLSFCLSLPAMASGSDFTLSEDWQTITYQGTVYRRADLSAVSFVFYDDWKGNPELSVEQQTQLRDSTFRMDESRQFIAAEFHYRDGSTLSCGFVSEALYPTFQTALTSQETPCYVEFYWRAEVNPKAAESSFFGTPATLTQQQLQMADTYPVYVDHNFGQFQIIKGTLLALNNKFYYVNHAEVGIYTDYILDPYEYDSLSCYKITDEALLEDLRTSLSSSFSFAAGASSLLGIFTVSFWVFVFGIIPAGILVLAILFFCRGKGYYRRVWSLTGLFAIVELALFIAVTVLLYFSL